MYSPRKPFTCAYVCTIPNLGGNGQNNTKNTLGNVNSLSDLNTAYSRKRGAAQFNYIVGNDSKYDRGSPFSAILPQLPLLLSCILRKTSGSASVVELQCLLALLNRVCNERVSRMFNSNSRDDGIGALFVNISFLYQELVQYRLTLQQLKESLVQNLSSSSKFNGLAGLYELVVYASTELVPSLLVRTKRILVIVVNKVSHHALSKLFREQNHSMFLGYYSNEKSKNKGSGGGLSCCSADGVNSTCGTYEVIVAADVKMLVDDPVNRTVIEAIQQFIAMTIEINALSCSNGSEAHSREVLNSLLTVILNSALQSLLNELIHSKQLIDEFGIYKLYRIILKYQEYIVALKKHSLSAEGSVKIRNNESSRVGGITSSLSATGGGGMLIQDLRIWKKAEFVLELLNKSIFARKQSSSNSGGGIGSGAGGSRSSAESGSQFIMRSFRVRAPSTRASPVFNINTLAIHSDYITMEEQKQWIELTDNEFTQPTSAVWDWLGLKGGKSGKWKHKGTVNIALSIPMNDL